MTTTQPNAIAWLQYRDTEWRQKLAKLPAHMHRGVSEYVAFGWPTGGFLTEVFSNRLIHAFRQADDENLKAMREWAAFVYWDVPASCQGSPEKVAAWQAQGGLRGVAP